MVINQNNSQISSFTKGMNSDSAYDQIGNDQYVYAKNVRITKNQLLGGANDYSSLHEGIVTPVHDGVEPLLEDELKLSGTDQHILNICTVDQLGTLITADDNDMYVYRFKIDEVNNKVYEFKPLLHAIGIWYKSPEQISAVLYKELENVIKLYIATGEHPIISFRVDDESVKDLNGGKVDIDDLINNRILPQNRVYIQDKISGRLLTSQVQYTYRCYNKYGNTTQLAPLTNKIQVIDPSRSKEIGNAENTETSVGFTLSIDLQDMNYDRIQLYRLQYIKPNADAEVNLIYDDKIKLSDGKFVFNDVGMEPLQSLTMEEFAAMSGLILVPQVIEQNQEYMFCANVKDDTIIKGVSIPALEERQHRYELVHANVTLSKDIEGAIPNPGDDKFTDQNILNYLEERGINSDLARSSYDNMFTSSLLRSLRRGEEYKYAIVYYDKYGRRTDVLPLDTVSVPDYKNDVPFELGSTLTAKPIGVKFDIPTPIADNLDPNDIVGCQIVRRSAADVYQKSLLQVALARPIRQGLVESTVEDVSKIPEMMVNSPYYPTGFLCTNDFYIMPIYYLRLFDGGNGQPLSGTDMLNAKTDSRQLYQIFSSEIDFRRDDVLSKLTTSGTTLEEQVIVSGSEKWYDNGVEKAYIDTQKLYLHDNGLIQIDRNILPKLSTNKKQAYSWIFTYYGILENGMVSSEIKSIKDVKIPNWEDSFTNIIKDEDQEIVSVIMKYKSYTTGIDQFVFNNWASWGKYDLPADHVAHINMDQTGDAADDNEAKNANDGREILSRAGYYNSWINASSADWTRNTRNGYIGPGSSCFLITLKENDGPAYNGNVMATSICNITHIASVVDVQSDEQIQYFGFGNYFPLKYNGTSFGKQAVVFDGDIYITPHELTTEYKTYNFESIDTLQSTQITNYIPLESKVNTFFDYGMNLRNTLSPNLLYEPGSIEGVTNQERPAHQYNMIYSDNDASNDLFTLISTDESETNQFKQRAYYSEMKTNGEFIDNFLIYKAASFIDVDSKYGEITNLYTDRNMLFYWQDHAFGKFSVNERSLVSDQNSNTIMLGQAGILSRYDYISTKYGMRLHDFCAMSTENGICWVDINNKAVVVSSGTQAVNYGEQLGVQNIINDKITKDVPQVDFDLQNSEILCKCLGEEQIVFNAKYNISTSLYTRDYDKMAYIKNHMYSFKVDKSNVVVKKHNYIDYASSLDYLSPLMLNLIVNPAASIVKVFDSQQMIPIKRDSFLAPHHILDNTQMAFETDLVKKTYGTQMEPYTDREGNIIYNVPRYMNEPYGNRIRGKWLKVDINNNKPTDLFTISHIITKYRQSYS